MKIVSKLLASAALLTVSVAGTAASAAPLLFSYTPTTDTNTAFTFEVDSNPTPTSVGTDNFAAPITGATGQYAGVTSLFFYNAAGGGGFGDYFGAQLFTGTLAAPALLTTGTFPLIYSDDATSAGTLTISSAVAAVPEPATWAMMFMGLGAVGFAMRRRQKVTTRVSYAA